MMAGLDRPSQVPVGSNSVLLAELSPSFLLSLSVERFVFPVLGPLSIY